MISLVIKRKEHVPGRDMLFSFYLFDVIHPND